MVNGDWRPPNYYGKGFQERVSDADPGITREDFERRLGEFLMEERFQHQLEDELIDYLFERICNARKAEQAVEQMEELTRSKDWKERKKFVSKLRRSPSFRALTKWVEQRHNPKLPLTSAVSVDVLLRLEAMMQDLWNIEEAQDNDEALVSNHLKPKVISQRMLDMYDHLRSKKPSWRSEDCKILITGCLKVANLSQRPPAVLLDAVSMRISRAKKSATKAATQNWDSSQEIRKGEKRDSSGEIID